MFYRITQVIFGCLIAMFIIEGILQLINNQDYDLQQIDPSTGLLIYKPGATYSARASCFENKTLINNLGFNARTVSPNKSPNTFRIILVGGSFIEGIQIPQEKNVALILEKYLNTNPDRKLNYEVIPMGMSGNNTYLEVLYFVKYGTPLNPDLVINVATPYEINHDTPNATHPPQFDENGALVLNLPLRDKNKFIIALKNFQKKSKLLVVLNLRRTEVMLALKNFLAHPVLFGSKTTTDTLGMFADDIPTENLWETEEKIVARFSNVALDGHIKFLLATWFPADSSADLQKNFLAHYNIMSKKGGFPYLDLSPAIAAHIGSPVLPCDGHWNANGHAWAAETLYNYLIAHPKLIGP